jgi:hypothetical protein
MNRRVCAVARQLRVQFLGEVNRRLLAIARSGVA